MKTKFITINPKDIDKKKIEDAGALIAKGELVAFPTETVYGLGGDALDQDAAKKIYAAKGRPSDNPLIVHIAELGDLKRVAKHIPAQAMKLAEAFWPGPLTMVVEKGDQVPYTTTGGLDTVAVRMPNHPIALELIRKSGCLIAAPSANTSGRPSPTEAIHVKEDLEGKIPMILDGGRVGIGIESTIVDLTEERPMVLRPGYITPAMLSKALGEAVVIDPGLLAIDDTKKPKAPGMKYKHYAPKADMIIVDGEEASVTAWINQKTKEWQAQDKKVAVIATEETKSLYHADVVLSIGTRENEDTIARYMYKILRDCDELNVDMIYSECFQTPRIGQAIMNRWLKAAGHQVVHAGEEGRELIEYDKVIFIGQSGTCRDIMAAEIAKELFLTKKIEVLARGLVVSFAEPINQKAEAVLISNGFDVKGRTSVGLKEEEITETTLILTMDKEQRKKVVTQFENAKENQVFVLTDFVGDELEIINPYGGTLTAYGLCYESLRKSIKKLVKILNKGE